MKRALWLAGAGILLLLLGGCGPSLKSIQTYSTTTLAAGQEVKNAINGVYESCQRSQGYKNDLDALDKDNQAEEVNVDSILSTIPEMSSDNIINCEDLATHSAVALLSYDVFLAYVRGLGNLSADDIIQYNARLTDVSSKIKLFKDNKGNPIVNEAQLNAVQGIADILLGAAKKVWQKHELNKYIGEAEIHIHTFLDHFIVFLHELKKMQKREITNITLLYNMLINDNKQDPQNQSTENNSSKEIKAINQKIQSLETTVNHTSITSNYLLEKEKKEKIKEAEDKIQAIDSAINITILAMETHDNMAKSLDDLDADLLNHFIDTYYEKAVPAIKELENAFD